MATRRPTLSRVAIRRAGQADSTATGTVTLVQSTDGSLEITNPTTTPDLSVTSIAKWTLGICRVYAVDGVNGNDANRGYADPATSSAADYAIACAAAGAVAKKTLAGLGAIFPRNGRGRLVEIVVAAGTYAEPFDTIFAGTIGYAQMSTLRGTALNAAAGVAAFDGSAADCTVAGAQNAAGMNATGYNPDAATSAVLTLALVGGGAAAFAAEPARPVGMTLRFSATTTTVAQRGKCYPIIASSGATVTINASIARVASDVLFIDDAGVVVASSNFGDNCMPAGPQTFLGWQFVGVSWSGTSRFFGGRWQVMKCNTTGLGAVNDGFLVTNQSYFHPVRASLTVGTGFYNTGTFSASKRAGFIGNYYTGVGLPSTSSPSMYAMNAGCVLAGWQWNGGVLTDNNTPTIGSGTVSTTNPAVRVISAVATRGGLDIEAGRVGISSVNITGAGALPAIKVFGGDIGVAFASDKHGVCGGSTGNNDVGLDMTAAYGCNIAWNLRPTVTGALGDVRQAGGAIVTWAALALLGTSVDAQGNRYSGP